MMLQCKCQKRRFTSSPNDAFSLNFHHILTFPPLFITLCHSHFTTKIQIQKNRKENNSEEWVIYRSNNNPWWSLTNRNNPWLLQHHQCFIIITLTTTLSNAVHHHHLLLINHHPRSILSTQAILPVMASMVCVGCCKFWVYFKSLCPKFSWEL